MEEYFEKTAYHKNGLETATRNVMFQNFFISQDKDVKEMWLGDGVYFWEKSSDAVWWNGGYKSDTILAAKLKCLSRVFVNLDLNDEKAEFDEFCRKTAEQMSNEGSFEFDPDCISSFFFNVFKETYGILLLKYSFPKRNSRPQYCATDNSIISDIRIVAKTINGRLEWC